MFAYINKQSYVAPCNLRLTGVSRLEMLRVENRTAKMHSRLFFPPPFVPITTYTCFCSCFSVLRGVYVTNIGGAKRPPLETAKKKKADSSGDSSTAQTHCRKSSCASILPDFTLCPNPAKTPAHFLSSLKIKGQRRRHRKAECFESEDHQAKTSLDLFYSDSSTLPK